jgi:hypothetical protein
MLRVVLRPRTYRILVAVEEDLAVRVLLPELRYLVQNELQSDGIVVGVYAQMDRFLGAFTQPGHRIHSLG